MTPESMNILSYFLNSSIVLMTSECLSALSLSLSLILYMFVCALKIAYKGIYFIMTYSYIRFADLSASTSLK